jgi:hypothetical protein
MSAVMLAVGMLGAIGWGAEKVQVPIQKPQEITASLINVVDKKGVPQITLGAEDGNGLIYIQTADRSGSILMSAGGGMSFVKVAGKDEKKASVLIASQDGEGVARFTDKNGQVTVVPTTP